MTWLPEFITMEEDSLLCVCDCGCWFDLDEGYPSIHSNAVICPKCHEAELNENTN